MTRQYAVCQSCAVVLSNADTSHIEESEIERITAAVESIGLVSHVAVDYNNGYWNCDICDETLCDYYSEIYETL